VQVATWGELDRFSTLGSSLLDLPVDGRHKRLKAHPPDDLFESCIAPAR
jgi:hypothetical protein